MVDDPIEKVIKNFLEDNNERKRLDNKYHQELAYLEVWLNETKSYEVRGKGDDLEYNEILDDFKQRWKKNDLKEMVIDEVEIDDVYLITKEFNLFWNNHLIIDGYRSWRRQCTNAIWKNEILNSGKLEDLSYIILKMNLIGILL